MGFSWEFMGQNGTSGNLPIKNGDVPWFFLCLPEGIASGNDCYITIGK
jgi:hypothetical protein